jgi:hypothetical protein
VQSAPGRGPFAGSGRHPAWLPWPERLVLLGITALLVWQVLLPPLVGLADNGDFTRIAEPLGLTPVPEGFGERYFGHVNRWYTVGAPQAPDWWSSGLLTVGAAVRLDEVSRPDGLFDVRTAGAVHLLLFLGGVWVILRAAGLFSGAVRAVIVAAVGLVTTDVMYFQWCNSLYGETAALLALLWLVGLTLWAVRTPGCTHWLIPTYVLLAVLLVAAKPAYYVLAVPLAVFPLVLLLRKDRMAADWVVIAGCVAVLGAGTALYAHVPPAYRSAVLWDTLFGSVLTESPSPEQDLQEMGLDPALARHAGKDAWAYVVAEGAPTEPVTAGYSFRDIVGLYQRHPDRGLRLAQRAAEQTFQWRPARLGNFTAESGQPAGARAAGFIHWSGSQHRLLPGSLGFLGVFALLFLGVCAWEIGRHGLGHPAGTTAAFLALMGLLAMVAFSTCSLASGRSDIVKHLFLFQVLFDVCLVAAVAWVVGRIWAAAFPASSRKNRNSVSGDSR